MRKRKRSKSRQKKTGKSFFRVYGLPDHLKFERRGARMEGSHRVTRKRDPRSEAGMKKG